MVDSKLDAKYIFNNIQCKHNVINSYRAYYPPTNQFCIACQLAQLNESYAKVHFG